MRRSADDHVAWSQKDVASYLADGFDPGGDYAGGAMVEVIRNTSLLPAADLAAIGAYIASLPPRQGPKPPAEEMIKITCEAGSARHYLITEWGCYGPPKALNVMMVRVSCTPAMVCTFSAMKWPMSVVWST